MTPIDNHTLGRKHKWNAEGGQQLYCCQFEHTKPFHICVNVLISSFAGLQTARLPTHTIFFKRQMKSKYTIFSDIRIIEEVSVEKKQVVIIWTMIKCVHIYKEKCLHLILCSKKNFSYSGQWKPEICAEVVRQEQLLLVPDLPYDCCLCFEGCNL